MGYHVRLRIFLEMHHFCCLRWSLRVQHFQLLLLFYLSLYLGPFLSLCFWCIFLSTLFLAAFAETRPPKPQRSRSRTNKGSTPKSLSHSPSWTSHSKGSISFSGSTTVRSINNLHKLSSLCILIFITKMYWLLEQKVDLSKLETTAL